MPGAWRVERRNGVGRDWTLHEDDLSIDDAESLAVRVQHTYPLGQVRLHDAATGEVVHIGADGYPLVPMKITRTTPDQEAADRAADLYEATLEGHTR